MRNVFKFKPFPLTITVLGVYYAPYYGAIILVLALSALRAPNESLRLEQMASVLHIPHKVALFH